MSGATGMNEAIEERHLAQAESHIAQAESHITAQVERIRTMVLHGQDTTLAEALLQTMRETLERMHEHRRMVLAELRDAG